MQKNKNGIIKLHLRIYIIIAVIISFVIFALFLTSKSLLCGWDETKHFSGLAFFENRIWFTQDSSYRCILDSFEDANIKTSLLSMSTENNHLEKTHTSLDPGEYFLVAGKDRLWILSTKTIMYYMKGTTYRLANNANINGEIQYAFLQDEIPSVIAENTQWTVKNRTWMLKETFKCKLCEDSNLFLLSLRPITYKGNSYYFTRYKGKVYFYNGIPKRGAFHASMWEPVCMSNKKWNAAIVKGVPYVFIETGNYNKVKINAFSRRNKKWQKAYSHTIYDSLGLFFKVLPEINNGNYSLLFILSPNYKIVSASVKNDRTNPLTTQTR